MYDLNHLAKHLRSASLEKKDAPLLSTNAIPIIQSASNNTFETNNKSIYKNTLNKYSDIESKL